MPTDDRKNNNCFSDGSATGFCDGVTVSMTKSSSYMSSASSSSYSTSNTCDGEISMLLTSSTTAGAQHSLLQQQPEKLSPIGSRQSDYSTDGDQPTTPATDCDQEALPVVSAEPTNSTSTSATAIVHREGHRVKFAEDRNEYLTSSDVETDYGSSSGSGGVSGPDDGHEQLLPSSSLSSHCREGRHRGPGGSGGVGKRYAGRDESGAGIHDVTTATYRPIIKQTPQVVRPQSPEDHDNPFSEDGELRRKADYILRYSTISRRRIRIADPDCQPLQLTSSNNAEPVAECSKGITTSGYNGDGPLSFEAEICNQTASFMELDSMPVSDRTQNGNGNGFRSTKNGSPPGATSSARLPVNGKTGLLTTSATDDDDRIASSSAGSDCRVDILLPAESCPTTALLEKDERADRRGNGTVGGNESRSGRAPTSGRRKRPCCAVQ